MKFTEEEHLVLGDPSERMVQEALFAVVWATEDDGTAEALVNKLCAWESITEHQARHRIMEAVADGEVGVTINDDLTIGLWLDPVTEARIERRHNYHALHKQGSDVFHPHVADEDWHARCAIRSWSHDHDGDLPTWHDLIEELSAMLGSECSRSGAKHITLNALASDAIYMTGHPTRSETVRFATTEDTDPGDTL